VRDVEVPTVNDMPFTSSVYLIFFVLILDHVTWLLWIL